MPTIPQLPPTSQVYPADEIPLSQAGLTRTATVGTLLASTQPAILAPTGTLLGRTSLGAGGPEPLNVGVGLALTGFNLTATGSDHASFATQSLLSPTDEVVLNSSGNPKRMLLGLLRGLFSAGANIAIDPSGTISGIATSKTIADLNQVGTVTSSDFVGISQSGSDHAITYANFINGQTIDLALPALTVSDSDTYWVAQGSSTMLRQSFAAVWSWIASKISTYKLPVIELTSDTTLDGTVHNGRVLICSTPITLTPVFLNMGSGFYCDIINLSGGAVTLGPGILSSSGSSFVPAGQYANLRAVTYSVGNIIFAMVSGGGSSLAAPGQVIGLSTGTITPTSITVAWSVPTTGGAPASYLIQYRASGMTTWLTAAALSTSTGAILAGLTSSTAYNIQVSAMNPSGSGAHSSILTANTTATGLVTSITWGLLPAGSYAHGSGSIGMNAHVNPPSATIQFGFSNSATIPPGIFVAGTQVAADLWAAYVGTPNVAGTWYSWAEGTDGSAPTVSPTAFTVS